MTGKLEVKYRAASLEAIAQLFDERARLADKSGDRAATHKERDKLVAEAGAWNAAAAILRSTTIDDEAAAVGTSRQVGDVAREVVAKVQTQ